LEYTNINNYFDNLEIKKYIQILVIFSKHKCSFLLVCYFSVKLFNLLIE